MMLPRVQGYVLAGGESSRMQREDLPRDKALLRLGGTTLLERAMTVLGKVCVGPKILCGVAERCARLGHAGVTVPDRVLLAGPLGGLHAALFDARENQSAWILVTPVDLPWMSADLLEAFLLEALTAQAPVACMREAGRVQPLPVILHADAEPFVYAALLAGERKLRPVLESAAERCGARTGLLLLDVEQIALPGDTSVCFRNVNTPEDFHDVQRDETPGGGLHLSTHGG